MTFRQEELTLSFQLEIQPLLDEHHKEVAMYQDKIDLAVDWEKYAAMADIDTIRIYTWREEDELVGYNVFFLSPHPHYVDHEFAVNDILYVHPDHRGVNVATFLNHCEEQLVSEGASVVTYHMKEQKPFHELMQWLEYDHAEHVYTKYVGE